MTTTYAGDHGGCMGCDRTGWELADQGHRKWCRSSVAHEPRRPKEYRVQMRRAKIRQLRHEADKLEAEAVLLESGQEVNEE